MSIVVSVEVRKKNVYDKDELRLINRWENGKTIPNITAMKSLKAFCEAQNLPYAVIHAEWIKEKE